ncbi:MAG TPA: hypothetical protein VF101_04565 [Gaiellaceae bacterium]
MQPAGIEYRDRNADFDVDLQRDTSSIGSPSFRFPAARYHVDQWRHCALKFEDGELRVADIWFRLEDSERRARVGSLGRLHPRTIGLNSAGKQRLNASK